MTSKQVLARVKALKPTPFDDETLLYWLGCTLPGRPPGEDCLPPSADTRPDTR